MLNENDEYFYGRARGEDIDAELEDCDDHREANVFWVPESARWEVLRAAAKQTDIGKRRDAQRDRRRLAGALLDLRSTIRIEEATAGVTCELAHDHVV